MISRKFSPFDPRTAVYGFGVAVAIICGGAWFYSTVLDCPDIIVQRNAELELAQAERAKPQDEAVSSCAQDKKLLTALVNLRLARSRCSVRGFQPAQSSSPPAPHRLDDMTLDVQREIAKNCVSPDGAAAR